MDASDPNPITHGFWLVASCTGSAMLASNCTSSQRSRDTWTAAWRRWSTRRGSRRGCAGFSRLSSPSAPRPPRPQKLYGTGVNPAVHPETPWTGEAEGNRLESGGATGDRTRAPVRAIRRRSWPERRYGSDERRRQAARGFGFRSPRDGRPSRPRLRTRSGGRRARGDGTSSLSSRGSWRRGGWRGRGTS